MTSSLVHHSDHFVTKSLITGILGGPQNNFYAETKPSRHHLGLSDVKIDRGSTMSKKSRLGGALIVS